MNSSWAFLLDSDDDEDYAAPESHLDVETVRFRDNTSDYSPYEIRLAPSAKRRPSSAH